jgi:glycosyltransferase involved in cell wall biosynthesis
MIRTKLTYIVSNVHKSFAFEWISEFIDHTKIDLSFILLNPNETYFETYLIRKGIKVSRVTLNSKWSIPLATSRVLGLLLKNRPDAIHAHLFEASLIGLFSAWLLRIKKRIYTRHHSNFHHDFFPRAVKYDKFCNFLATDIVAVSGLVKEILFKLENTPKRKLHLIHHGILFEQFNQVSIEQISQLKTKYGLSTEYPIIGVIARYTEWKGIQFIIPAFKELLIDYPSAKLVLANAHGDFEPKIRELLNELPSSSYIEIKFENNLFALYRLFDLFVHVPFDKYFEAFGQVYIEALASKVPSVFTLSGIANEFIRDNENAKVVPYKNSDAVHEAMMALLNNSEFCEKLISKGYNDVNEFFSLDKMISKLEKLYLS